MKTHFECGITHSYLFLFPELSAGVMSLVCLFVSSFVGDDELPGNMALLDQLEAFKWVQRHIRCKYGRTLVPSHHQL